MTTPETAARVQPWDWRLAYNHGFIDRDSKPTFHAHDEDDRAACKPFWVLLFSAEPPNEGSHLCPECMEIVQRHPRGRPATSPDR